MSKVAVYNLYPKAIFLLPFDKISIAKILEFMLAHPGLTRYKKIFSIDFYILDDVQISCANKKYMLSSGPTNVLSFPGGDKDFPGSILLSADAFERETILYGQPRKEYFIYLISHAFGHLAGLDHGVAMSRLCGSLTAAGINVFKKPASAAAH